MNVMETDLDIISDMFDTLYDDNIASNKEEEYYIGKAENILQQIKENKDYYIFLKVFMKRYHELDTIQKKDIVDSIGLKPEERVVYREKIVYKEKKADKKNNAKPKLNMTDDY